MKSSKSWSTVTPLSKNVALFVFFLLPILGFYFGTQYQTRMLADQSQNDQGRLAELQNQLTLANEGRAQLMSSEVRNANEISLPVHSTLFADKDVTVRQWQFRGNPMTEYEIALSADTSTQVRIWEYSGESTTRLVRIEKDGGTTPLELGLEGIAPYSAKNKVQQKWNRYSGKLTSSVEPTSRRQVYVEIAGDEITGLPVQKEGFYLMESTKDLEPVADTIIF